MKHHLTHFDQTVATGEPGGRRRTWASGLVAAVLFQAPACFLLAGAGPGIVARPLPAAVVDAIPVDLSPEARRNLMESGSCSTFSQERPAADLCPDPAARADLLSRLNAAHPTIGVQTLVVAVLPAGLAARADRNLVLYNLIHQFHSMEGIPYYSATHGKERTFFTSSHLVKGPGDLSRLGDPHFLSIEPSHDLYLEQDDTTFGKNLYAVTVQGRAGGTVELTMTNVEQVRYAFVPVLGPGGLTLTMVVRASADGKFLYFYGNAGLRALRVPGLEEKVRTSFYNRIIALYNWFAKLSSSS